MTTPYIGSKISLISQLDIRYEGFLHKGFVEIKQILLSNVSVDPVESTISLSRVRSFGTEDRLANVIVPARKEVYDYIIFKASDIKDLIVCDTPKPTPDIDDITYDPAIISVSKPPLVMPSSTEERKATQGSFLDSYICPSHNSIDLKDSGASSLKANKFGAQFESRQQQRDATTNEQLSGRFGQSVRHQFYQQGAVQGQRQPHKYINWIPISDHQISYQQQQHSYNGDHRPHHQHYYYNQARNTRKYDGDFDFEKANEDFLESVDGVIDNIAELDLEHSDFHSPPKDKSPTQEIDGEINDDKVIAVLEKSTKNDIYYDKSRSFFDNISCEATEREAGKDNRIDWKKERLTNEVTFGPAAVRMHNFHRRGSRGGAAPHLRRVGYFNNQQQRRYGAGPPANISGGVFERQSTKQNK
uniref:FFD domain-containing protein n=1 Tax=Meloidogyne hapla TaxID=6305 RepID=A0A1I8BL38_MELHA